MPPLQSEYSSSRSQIPPSPYLKSHIKSFFLPLLSLAGCRDWRWGISTGSAFCKAYDPVRDALGSTPGCRLGPRSCSSRTFCAGADAVFCRSDPVAAGEPCWSLPPPRLPLRSLARPRVPPPPSLPPSAAFCPSGRPISSTGVPSLCSARGPPPKVFSAISSQKPLLKLAVCPN